MILGIFIGVAFTILCIALSDVANEDKENK